MKLMKVITTYVVLKQSLGTRFESTGRVLRQFGRSMGDIAIDEAGPREVAAFLRGKERLSATWTVKYRAHYSDSIGSRSAVAMSIAHRSP